MGSVFQAIDQAAGPLRWSGHVILAYRLWFTEEASPCYLSASMNVLHVGLAFTPVTFVAAISILTRRLSQGKWTLRQFVVGTELAVATIATLLDHLLDMFRCLHGAPGPKPGIGDAVASGLMLVAALVVMLYILTIDHEWEREPANRRSHAKALWLLLVANGLGAGLLVLFGVVLKD